MTSEICIMNELGVVLAADSAVTVSDGKFAKTYNTVNKLFSLDRHDIGIMINGNATFNKLSLGTVINEFKKFLGDDKLDTVRDYAESFIEYLDAFPEAKTNFAEIEMIKKYTHDIIDLILQRSEKVINEVIKNGQRITDDKLLDILIECTTEIYQILTSSFEPTFNFDDNYFNSNYSNLITGIIDYKIYNNVPDVHLKTAILNLIKFVLKTDFEIISKSSLVFAGYGDKEVLPAMVEIELNGSFNQVIKYNYKNESKISINQNKMSEIMSFAQTDMIDTVIQGSHPYIDQKIIEIIKATSLDEREKECVLREIDDYKFSEFIYPFHQTIVNLPLVELPHMAETLINLTSFKRKYSQNLESVGGPVDTLTISKGEGPIWISRKHYFNIDNNLEYRIRKGG